MTSQNERRHYKDIAFFENRKRLRLLKEFQYLVIKYFRNSTLNMVSGNYIENSEAKEAKTSINLIIKKAYSIIRYADIKTYTASTPSISISGRGRNIDLILNIFNLGRNDIKPNVAEDYINRAIDVYKSNRLPSLIRTINPFFWMALILKYR